MSKSVVIFADVWAHNGECLAPAAPGAEGVGMLPITEILIGLVVFWTVVFFAFGGPRRLRHQKVRRDRERLEREQSQEF